MPRPLCLLIAALAQCVALVVTMPASAQSGGTADLRRMSLEDLLDVRVTTVSRRPEATSEVPAAVFVITQDDIRRSGASSLAEALRLAPGIQVAQIGGGTWATGMRGFADRLSRAMLVLIDGRAVYSPLFAGTYWEVQETMLEDVDRIEVIRGPGGTLWGANAVNGIINIVTRRASETQGVLATAEGGAYGHAIGALRYGGTARQGALNYRFYGKGLQRADELQFGSAAGDGPTMAQAGGRADWLLSRVRTFTVQGDAYGERLPEQAVTTFYTPPYRDARVVHAPLSGGNVLARLTGGGSAAAFQLQTYYDRTNRDEVPVGEDRDTFDIDFQQNRPAGARHRLSFGAGYRVSTGRITAVSTSMFTPSTRTDNLFSAFGQDEVMLIRNRLRGSIGLKAEHNSYTGLELQPSARLLWTLDTAQTVFGAVTRAVRTPSRVETDYSTTSLASAAVPAFVRLEPNPGFRPEDLVAYEAGYRVRPVSWAYLTLSGFYNSLDDLLSTELVGRYTEGTPPEPARLILPVMFRNGLFGESHGAEFTGDVRPAAWLRTTLNYSYLKVAVTQDPFATDVSQEKRYEGISPRHQVQVQAAVDLPHRISADWITRHVSSLPVGPVPAYTTSSVRVGWQVTSQLEIAAVGQDFTQAKHLEWPGGADIRRRGYVKVTWRQR